MEDLLSYVYSQSPPPVLYHYTNQAGLLGILKSRAVWATHTQYLNDRSEYSHASQLARRQISQKTRDAGTSDEDIEILEVMQNALIGVERLCVCVFSLSEDRDSLSQWRAYGGGSSGFAIGIGRDTLREVGDRPSSPRLGKCIYDPIVQIKLIAQLVDAVLNEARKLRTEQPDDWHANVSEKMEEYMHGYAPLLKHHKFSDEKEWRLITGPISPIAIDLQFRAGVSMITPYFQISLDGPTPDHTFAPKEIVVGPAPAHDYAAAAVVLLLLSRGMVACAENGVIKSVVPYRSW